MDDWPCDLGNDVARARRAHAARKARSSGPKLKDGISGPFRCYGDMDLPSYYRHQARGARRLAGLYREQRQTRVALERVAQEYNGIAQDIEKSCGRDLASSYSRSVYRCLAHPLGGSCFPRCAFLPTGPRSIGRQGTPTLSTDEELILSLLGKIPAKWRTS
jgi:hypothetical protein